MRKAFLGLVIGVVGMTSAALARADTVTLTCTGSDCPNPFLGATFGGSFEGFSILQFPEVLSTDFRTQLSFIQTLGAGGIFEYGDEQGQFGDGTLNCSFDCALIGQLETPALFVLWDGDGNAGLTITFDTSSLTPVPEPGTQALVVGGAFVLLAEYLRYKRRRSVEAP